MRGWRAGMAGVVVVAVGALSACGTTGLASAQAAARVTAAARAGSASRLPASQGSASGWRERVVDRLSSKLTDVTAGPRQAEVFETVTGPMGDWQLDRVDVATGAVTKGPHLAASQVQYAAGSVWVGGEVARGPSSSRSWRPILFRFSPGGLTRTGFWRLGGWAHADYGVDVVAGPGGTVWAGANGSLRQIRLRTGAVVRRVALPRGRLVGGLASAPGGAYLYVAAVQADVGGDTALEYAGRSGGLLYRAASTPLRYSVGGAALTAVPGGVWASFRTGMLGQTVLLRQHGLRTARLPHSTRQLYGWGMDASTGYSRGALLISSGVQGKTACVAPGTGQVRAQAVLHLMANGSEILSVSASAHRLLAVSDTTLVEVTTPARCWR